MELGDSAALPDADGLAATRRLQEAFFEEYKSGGGPVDADIVRPAPLHRPDCWT
jgi:hypothetical protein